MKEYGAKVGEAVEREVGEWAEVEKARLQGLRERPEEVVQWLDVYERVQGRKWMGDVHELLAVVEQAEPMQQQQQQPSPPPEQQRAETEVGGTGQP